MPSVERPSESTALASSVARPTSAPVGVHVQAYGSAETVQIVPSSSNTLTDTAPASSLTSRSIRCDVPIAVPAIGERKRTVGGWLTRGVAGGGVDDRAARRPPDAGHVGTRVVRVGHAVAVAIVVAGVADVVAVEVRLVRVGEPDAVVLRLVAEAVVVAVGLDVGVERRQHRDRLRVGVRNRLAVSDRSPEIARAGAVDEEHGERRRRRSIRGR